MQEFSIREAKEYNNNILKPEIFIVSGYCDYNSKQRNEKFRYAQLINFDGSDKITILEGEDVLLAGVFYRLKVKPYIQKNSNELALRVIEVINEENDFIYNYKHFSVIKKKLENGTKNIDEYLERLLDKEKLIKIGYITLKNSVAQSDIEKALFEGNRKYISSELVVDIEAVYNNFEALKDNEDKVDVWIVTRGGGYLSFFNSYKVLDKISSLEKPIISALGHSTDYTLTDFIADRVFSTPTAFGEYLNKALNKYKYNKTGNDREKEELKNIIDSKDNEINYLRMSINNKSDILKRFDNVDKSINEIKESIKEKNTEKKNNGKLDNVLLKIQIFTYIILILLVIKIMFS